IQLCARLEALGETGNLEPAAAAFAALAQETRRLEHFLDQARNEGRR
ncbi:MAG: hypothetical protein IH608_05245, partial [Proteobacteria bacterium]|nr:hypothetical protein [Pseudomonadota bacterium]